MKIERLVSPYLSSNMYLVEEGVSAILIDPFIEQTVYRQLKKRNIVVSWIYTTHEHFDHISGVNWWRERTGGRVLCSRECAERMADPRHNLSHYFDAFAQVQSWAPSVNAPPVEDYVCHADETFENERGDIWEGHKLYLRRTEGHSTGSSCMLLDDDYLFAGDSLLQNYPVVTRTMGGNRYAWEQYSKPWFTGLSKQLRVLPGHFESFRLADYKFFEEE